MRSFFLKARDSLEIFDPIAATGNTEAWWGVETLVGWCRSWVPPTEPVLAL